MTWGMYGAFIFTVALLVFTAYFLLGGLPLLVLKHDVPLDARFVRAFFNVYYKVAFWAALGAAASYALWGGLLSPLARPQSQWWWLSCESASSAPWRRSATRSEAAIRSPSDAFAACTAPPC